MSIVIRLTRPEDIPYAIYLDSISQRGRIYENPHIQIEMFGSQTNIQTFHSGAGKLTTKYKVARRLQIFKNIFGTKRDIPDT